MILNWSEYLDPELVDRFEVENDVRITEVYFESDDTRTDMLLETDAVGYDLVMVNGASLEDYLKRGWLAPLPADGIPNLKHIDNEWRNAFRGAADYGVPYFWGTTGIAYRKDLVKEEITSWRQLYEPAEYLSGKIVMINHSRDLIGMALKALGYSANSADSGQLEAAERLVLAQKPYVNSYTTLALDEESALYTGEAYIAMSYSGDALALADLHPEIAYVLPEEGGNIWVDYLVVIESSRNKELAYRFINFLNEPDNASQLAEYVYYATPNKAAERLLPEEFLADSTISPDASMLSKSESYAPLPPRSVRNRNAIYSSAIR